MKKFVGNVNGNTYSDYDEFTKAVNDAIASGESPMVISSYYKEDNCDELECKDSQECIEDKSEEKNDEKTPVNLDDILLNENSIKYLSGKYAIPLNIDELFKNASNIDEIKKSIDEKINYNKNIIKDVSDTSNKLKNDIYDIKKEIKELNDKEFDAKNQIKYYDNLNAILNKDEYESNLISDDDSDDTNDSCGLYDLLTKSYESLLKDIGFWL